MMFVYLCKLSALLILLTIAQCQIINRAPQFVPGSGDMARFSLSENTPVGSPIYQLKGVDPEGGTLHYSISGPVFSVDRDTGVVRLRQQLDRETQDLVEVIISITDEGVLGTEPNTVSLRREIPIRDYNDNSPVFHGRPYTATISESTNLQTEISVHPKIIVTDRDEGQNSDVNLSCFNDGNKDSDICDTFHVATEKLSEGNFTTVITLLKPLDFETRPSYLLTIMAKDGAASNALSAFATVSINVIDVQDQPPIFLQAPYSVTIAENTPEDTSVLTISAIDGDTGNPRPILLTLENEVKGHFKLEPIGKPGEGKAILYTTMIATDREDPEVLQNGGVYTFTVKATEMINNELPGDFALTQVTVVLTDVDDNLPEFNQLNFEIGVTENLENDTPLPGLSMYVLDKDLGANSRYNLSLKNVLNAENVFAVSPTYGEGRTPIVVKVTDSSKLDYDVQDEKLRTLIFDVVASVNKRELAMTRITVHLQDANDNSPVFRHHTYRPKVKENSGIGTKIADIIATDADDGKFGEVYYMLRGFGVEYFSTDRYTGGLYVKKNLDYEEQRSYSLSIVAVDGGGQETNANLYVDVIDLNDNAPQFESLEYTRTIREGATEFEPQFFVRAIDVDGPTQGDGKILYSIESENSISGHVFAVNPQSGEIQIVSPVSSMDTERGQYELVVAATDYGSPPLKNTTRVLIRVGISGNQRPVFKGHFDATEKGPKPGPPKYKVSIPEIASAGYNVTTVTATDPDGLDSLLTYRIVGANDNFLINEKTGLVTVADVARLDRDTNPKSYSVVINAVDAGFPIPETATTTLTVNIDDVNDKPPKFNQQSYTVYVSEITPIHSEVLTVAATDTDISSNLSYSIIEPIKAASKTGIQLTSTTPYDYRSSFAISAANGSLTVRNPLNHDLAAVIRLTIKVVDLNAVYNKEEQFDTAEVTIYIQSFKDTNPIFRNKGWTSSLPVVNVKVKEEMPIGMVLFQLIADDPVGNRKIQSFEMIQEDPLGVFQLNDRTGEVMLKKRLDYEELLSATIEFSVKARSNEGRSTVTNVNVTVENVNDNSPEFEKKSYRATVMETALYPKEIVTVKAIDKDAELTDYDRLIGFHSVSYHLIGSNAGSFVIDNITGLIQIGPGQALDREKQSKIVLTVSAEDAPGKPSEKRKTTVEVIIDVLDVNDNPPMFSQKSYSAVIPENSDLNSLVANLSASDPDEGPGGEIRFEMLDEGDANGLFKINVNTGEIRTKKSLTGKGRSEPYELVIRAQDNGDQVAKQKSLYTDVPLVLFIGDVSSNDGIPVFVSPKVGQIANISESCESRETEDLKILFQFSHGPAMTQLKRLQQALRTLGTRVSFIGLSMTVVMNMEDILMGTIKSIDRCCPNLKSFYATGLFIRNKEFNENQLKTFFARLEEIILQMCGLEGVNTFSDCKKLKGWTWTQEIFNGFEGECLNFNFDDLRSIKFSKIDGIDSEHMQPFLLKNPHLKSITLTRCTIDANILKLISKHVPAIEEFTFNFRRSLVHRSDMQKNLKYLLKLQHLKALNLDCVGAAVGDVFSKMAGNPIPLERVGLFCFPWENSLIKAFGNLKDLKSLHLSNVTGLNDECLGYLSQSLVGLNDLTLKFIENITLDGVIKLMAKCQLLSTATIVLSKLTTISTDRYSMLLEAIKERPEKVKLTITLWESKNPLKLPKDLLNQNLEFLEILVEENELNKNTDFDFYCDSADGGYDVVSSTSPQDSGCFINCCLF